MTIPADSASVFNSVITAAALAAAFRLGLLDEVDQHGKVNLVEFARRENLDREALDIVVRALTRLGILRLESSTNNLSGGSEFGEFHKHQGYFYWLVAGYGPSLQMLGELVRNTTEIETSRMRSGPDIAVAARDYGRRFVDPVFSELVAAAEPQVVADIGCGTAGRLIELGARYPNLRGYGIEIEPQVSELARLALDKAGVSDRIEIVTGDVAELQAQPGFDEVDLLFSFFVGHDFWPRKHCLRVLKEMRALFPGAHRFLLCDTYRSERLHDPELPIFTLGFELTHALMRQTVPTRGQWLDLFGEAGWRCVAVHDVGIPFSCIFDLEKSVPHGAAVTPRS